MLYTASPLAWEGLLQQPLTTRFGAPPEDVIAHLRLFNESQNSSAHPISIAIPEDFLVDVTEAILTLPDTILQQLTRKLLGIFILDGVGSSALMDTVAYANNDVIGAFIAIDYSMFKNAKANAWISAKENLPFEKSSDVHIHVTIEKPDTDTRLSALQFVLLHEIGHIVALGSGALPEVNLLVGKEKKNYPFAAISWADTDSTTLHPTISCVLPKGTSLDFYGECVLSRAHIKDLYTQLTNTTLPTLYASLNVQEDFAESFATYVHSQLLGKAYQISIIGNNEGSLQLPSFWDQSKSQEKAAFFNTLLAQKTPISPSRQERLDAATLSVTYLQEASAKFLGLAPLLRLSIANTNLRELVGYLLQITEEDQTNAFLWMNLANTFFTLGEKTLGLQMQEQGLQLARTYVLPSILPTPKASVLLLCAPGDLAENTPLDCLLEKNEIELVVHYGSLDCLFPEDMSSFDAILVGFSDTPSNHPLLQAYQTILPDVVPPVINQAFAIPNTERNLASQLMHNIPGVAMPATEVVTSTLLNAICTGKKEIADCYGGCRFPLIIRPIDSHAGKNLEKISTTTQLEDYLTRIVEDSYYVSNFIDYRSHDGLFRKYRIALIDNDSYVCHMAISEHWMIHYVNAGMYDNATKRIEEAQFMANYGAFKEKHHSALTEIRRRSQLDYLCIDCGETLDGELLIFEIDHVMVVHAMDSPSLFPHKADHIKKVQTAFEELVYTRSAQKEKIHL